MELLYRHCHESPASPQKLNPRISPQLEAIVLRCLQKEPDHRYPSYASFLTDLDKTLPAPKQIKRGPWNLFPWVAAATGFSLLAAITWAVVRLREERPVPSKVSPVRPVLRKESVPIVQPPEGKLPIFGRPALTDWPPRAEPVEDSFAAHDPTPEELAFLASLPTDVPAPTPYTAGIVETYRKVAEEPDPVEALAILRSLWSPDLYPVLPALIQAIVRRALDAPDRKILTELDALPIPEEFRYVLKPRAKLMIEVEAREALAQGEFRRILVEFPHSKAHPEAVREVLARFRSELRRELITPSEFHSWLPDPVEARGSQVQFKETSIWISADRPRRSVRIIRRMERGPKGFEIRFRFVEGSPTFVVELSDDAGLDISKESLRLWRRANGGSEVVALPKRADTVTVLFLEGLVLVYIDGTLMFSPREPALLDGMRIGARGGRVAISSVRIAE